MILYNLSYDVKDYKKDFKDYDEAKRYLHCVIGSTNYHKITSPTESTLLIEYMKLEPEKLFIFLEKNLSKYFFYSISLIAVDEDNAPFIAGIENPELIKNFKTIIKKIDCSNLDKPITEY
ncbi:hypothetical protein CRN76_19110 [Chryseobacterium indologenes]|uniref:hypothetical protein n=1 Tax=Chryseobacterium indologenes TaxID=253 RepID=UPI000BFDDC54|nr:hypothetical protein [Chryseobacterium indologenes]ATN07350.1 hypothetical protein CRN76_19110 [Chryseobacterium indologenes]